MVQGFERRDVIEDAARKSRALEPLNVPLSPVMRPNPSSFAAVGEQERELAQALGKASVGLQAYVEKKSKQWELEGAMQRASGKTLEEARQNGNSYTADGWRALDTKIAGDELYMQERDNIQQRGKEMSPAEYQKYLSGRFKELSESKQDDDTRSMLDAYALDTYPKLVSEHTAAHLEFNRKQMIDKARKGGVSTAHADGPEATKEYLDTLRGSMSKEDFNAAAEGMLLDDLTTLKSGKVRDVIASTRTPTVRDYGLRDLSGLLNMIGQAESTNNYNAVWGGENPNLTKMSVDEVLAWQKQQVAGGAKSAAAGKYQFITKTLESLKGRLQLSGTELFNESMQDQLAVSLLQEDAKIGDYMSGKMSPEQFQAKLAGIWAGIPKDASGKSAYEGDGLNKATIEPGAVLQALGATATSNNLYDAMSELGMPSDAINRVLKANEALEVENSSKFEAGRLMAEKDLVASAVDLADADLFARIDTVKKQNGYSDNWAEGVWNQAQTARQKDLEERKKLVKIQNLMSARALQTGSKEEQEKAIDFVTNQAIAAHPDAMDPESPNHTQAKRAAQDQVYKFMYDQQITDNRLKSSWEVAVTGDIVDKDGKVKPDAIEAYSSYRQAKLATNDPAWAASLLSDKTQDVFFMADSHSASTPGADIDQSLAWASAYVQEQSALKGVNNLPWWKNLADTSANIESLIDGTLPGIMSAFGATRNQAQMRWEINGDGVAKAAKSENVQARIRMEAAKLWNSKKQWDDQDAARELVLAKATNKVMTKSEYVAGTFVYTGDGPTLSQRIGMGGIKNGANLVVSRVMDELGPDIWSDYNSTDVYTQSQAYYEQAPSLEKAWEFTKNAVTETVTQPKAVAGKLIDKAQEKARGIPDFAVMMNPSGNAVILAPYTNFDRTQVGPSVTLSVERMKEAASYLNKGDTAGFKEWANKLRPQLPKYK